jgi:hypothetical protein
MALLAAKTLGFCNGDALDANGLKGFLHLIELEGLNNGFDFFHV